MDMYIPLQEFSNSTVRNHSNIICFIQEVWLDSQDQLTGALSLHAWCNSFHSLDKVLEFLSRPDAPNDKNSAIMPLMVGRMLRQSVTEYLSV